MDFENKPEILSAIKTLQLSRNKVTPWSHSWGFDTAALEGHRRLWEFLTPIGWVHRHNWNSIVVYFYSDGVHWYDSKTEAVNNTGHERTHTGRGHFSLFQKLREKKKTELLMCKLVSVTKEGPPAMVDHSNWFIAKWREDNGGWCFLNYHYIIHQQALCAGMLNMNKIMDVAIKITYCIWDRSLQRRLFCVHLEMDDCDHPDLPMSDGSVGGNSCCDFNSGYISAIPDRTWKKQVNLLKY